MFFWWGHDNSSKGRSQGPVFEDVSSKYHTLGKIIKPRIPWDARDTGLLKGKRLKGKGVLRVIWSGFSHGFPLSFEKMKFRKPLWHLRFQKSISCSEYRKPLDNREFPTVKGLKMLLFQISRSNASAGPRKPCRDGPRREPSRGRCRGWRPGYAPWPS